MKGQGEVVMDDKTKVRWVLTPSDDARRRRPQPATTGRGERDGSLRPSLVAAAVEFASEGSDHRLSGTLHARPAP